jgi:hypothetical protein
MSENENNFESLRRLLVLKRHEVPPPGYFNRFSDSVVQGIREGQYAEPMTVFGRLCIHAPWLERIFQVFDAKPVFASGFVGALCLLLFFGVIHAERPDLTAQPMLSVSTASAESLAALSPAALSGMASQPGIVSSTNPVLSLQAAAPGSIFGQQNPLAQPVSFSIPGH